MQAEENTKIFDTPVPREDSTLFSLGEKSRVQMIFMLSPGEITPNPSQPRRFFTEDAILRLADSIRIHGIIQPLAVRRPEGGNGYELVAGERRLRAAKLLGLEQVPCVLMQADSEESAHLAIIENIQRENLNMFEQAAAIYTLMQVHCLTQEKIATQLSCSQSYVANKLRLLRLSPACRALLVEHGLTERHARCLLRLEDEGERLTALRQAAAKHWNVAQTEQYVERRLAALQTAPPAGRRTYIIKDVRLFLNSVDRGLRLIRDAGVDARTEREETEDEIVLTLRIPKQRRKEA